MNKHADHDRPVDTRRGDPPLLVFPTQRFTREQLEDDAPLVSLIAQGWARQVRAALGSGDEAPAIDSLPPCNCGSVDKHGDDLGEHSPRCPYHLAALAIFGALPAPVPASEQFRRERERETLAAEYRAAGLSPLGEAVREHSRAELHRYLIAAPRQGVPRFTIRRMPDRRPYPSGSPLPWVVADRERPHYLGRAESYAGAVAIVDRTLFDEEL